MTLTDVAVPVRLRILWKAVAIRTTNSRVGSRIDLARIYVVRARRSAETNRAYAVVGIDLIYTCATVAARIGQAFISVDATVDPGVARFA